MLWRTSLALLIFLEGLAPVIREVHLMGTHSVLAVHSEGEAKGEEQLESHIRILEETEAELSVWRPDTTLSRLNAWPVGEGFEAGPRLVALIEELLFWCKETKGAFDPGIGKVLDSRGYYGRKPTGPAPVVWGIQHLRLESEAGRVFRMADVWIDSGAFGKGEALDRVHRESKAKNFAPWMIDLGGQIMVYGLPPAKEYWTVDIADPQARGKVAFTVKLTSGSISISGNSEQPGHIIDPVTNRPVSFAGSVVVWAERALIADIVSTALFVMGPEKGIAWAEARGIAAAYLLPGSTVKVQATTTFSRLISTPSR